jgi:diaminohydroxyphosphoribosylaminopyrimidine deaminase/5-amino-6-(5-phosphoribosylamino)uracil reductase
MDYLGLALDLAEQAKGACNPNPAVGAVLVRDGQIVGSGHTRPRGQAHAEIVALDQAADRAAGADLYVTLEPCCHHGLTGPCTERLIAAGVRAVHCAMLDPSPWVNGGGRAQLERHGIPVTVGEHEAAARRLNRDYLLWVRLGRPLVIAKYAMTLDGKIATVTGSARWVSGEASRALVGRMRAAADAVLVGIGTVLADDPSLTARASDGTLLPRQPLRVVVDSQGRLPPDSKLAGGGLPGCTVVATTPLGQERLAALRRDGLEVWAGPPDPDGRVDLAALLAELGRRGLLSTLAEAGGTLLAALLERGLIDEIAAFVAPKLVGGRSAPTPIGGRGVADMAAAIELEDVSYERVGRDVLVRGVPKRCSAAS